MNECLMNMKNKFAKYPMEIRKFIYLKNAKKKNLSFYNFYSFFGILNFWKRMNLNLIFL